MEDVSNKMKEIRYEVEDLSIVIPNKSKPVTIDQMNIYNIIITKDFINNTFAQLIIDVLVAPDVYNQVVNNMEDVKVKVKINKFKDTDTSFKNTFINSSFKLSNPNLDPFLEKEIYSDMFNNKNNPNLDDNSKKLTLILFDEKIDKVNTIFNFIGKDTNLDTVFNYIFSKAGINYLQQPCDNSTIYNQLLIPPLNLLGITHYLNNFKGIYNNGLIFFYDFNLLYMCDLDETKCKVKQEKEIETVSIKVSDYKDTNKSTGVYKDNNKRIITYNAINGVNLSNPNRVIKEIGCNRLIAVDNKGGKIDKKLNINSNKKENSKVINMKVNNLYLINSMIKSTEIKNNVLAFYLIGVDMDDFTPNKVFNVTFTNTSADRFNGNYKLGKVAMQLIKDTTFYAKAYVELYKS